MKYARILVGLVIWTAIVVSAWYFAAQARQAGGATQPSAASEIWDYATGQRQAVALELPSSLDVEVGDPIYVIDEHGQPRQVGEIRLIRDPETGVTVRRAWVEKAEAMFYACAPALDANVKLTYFEGARSLDWVLETMLTQQKREQITALLKQAYQEHHQEILRELLPLVQKSLSDAAAVVERDLPKAIAAHKSELEEFGRKYQKDMVEEKIVPLVKNEIWPIVQRHAQPMAEQVGQELWNKLPKWGLAWRYMYDSTPLMPYKGKAKWKWDEFVKADALPVVQGHAGEFVGLVQEIMRDVGKNEEVRRVVREGVAEMVKDPKLQGIVLDVVRQTIIENPAFSEVLVQHWTGPEARRALSVALNRVDPTMNQIGHLLFGTKEGGFTPEFTRVLRARILNKDRRWFVLEVPADSVPPAERPAQLVLQVQYGDKASLDPFLHALAAAEHD
jgi:hypothetical protein